MQQQPGSAQQQAIIPTSAKAWRRESAAVRTCKEVEVDGGGRSLARAEVCDGSITADAPGGRVICQSGLLCRVKRAKPQPRALQVFEPVSYAITKRILQQPMGTTLIIKPLALEGPYFGNGTDIQIYKRPRHLLHQGQLPAALPSYWQIGSQCSTRIRAALDPHTTEDHPGCANSPRCPWSRCIGSQA